LHEGCLGLYQAIPVQFTLEVCIAACNGKNALKSPILEAQGH